MGTDMHGFLEVGYFYQVDQKWNWSASAEIFFDRNYTLFWLVARLRYSVDGYPGLEPKGFPVDAGFEAVGEYTLVVIPKEDQKIHGEGMCTTEQAERWLKHGSVEWDKTESYRRITNPDYHSATWLSTEEVCIITKQADLCDAHSDEFFGLAQWMGACETKTRKYRLVLYFDN